MDSLLKMLDSLAWILLLVLFVISLKNMVEAFINAAICYAEFRKKKENFCKKHGMEKDEGGGCIECQLEVGKAIIDGLMTLKKHKPASSAT